MESGKSDSFEKISRPEYKFSKRPQIPKEKKVRIASASMVSSHDLKKTQESNTAEQMIENHIALSILSKIPKNSMRETNLNIALDKLADWVNKSLEQGEPAIQRNDFGFKKVDAGYVATHRPTGTVLKAGNKAESVKRIKDSLYLHLSHWQGVEGIGEPGNYDVRTKLYIMAAFIEKPF